MQKSLFLNKKKNVCFLKCSLTLVIECLGQKEGLPHTHSLH